MQLTLATRNPHKVSELQSMLSGHFTVVPLPVESFPYDLEENGNDLFENSLEKATYIHSILNQPCLADDSGLEIDALNGDPGVHSANYCGTRDSEENIKKVLHKLHFFRGQGKRTARFRTVLTYIDSLGAATQYTGTVEGEIALRPEGTNGFGYDSIFIPLGHSQTFALMSDDEKSAISHRAVAIKAFLAALGSPNSAPTP